MTSHSARAIYEALLGDEYRSARRAGTERQLTCPLHDDNDTSLAIDERGAWICRGGCGGGDAGGLARQMLGDDDARDLLRELETTDPDEQANAATAARLGRIQRETIADDGTIAAYLRHRGLAGDVPPALRLHRRLPYFEEDARRVGDFPAIVATVQTLEGETVALHRTYLVPGGVGKAEVPVPKKLTSTVRSGATRGAAIQLAAPTDGRLALTEGIESALAVMEATGAPAWSCVSAGGLAAVELPADVREVELWADHDAAGINAANAAAARLHGDGRTVRVVLPSGDGDDWLDVLVRDGVEALCSARTRAQPWAATVDAPPAHPKRDDETETLLADLAILPAIEYDRRREAEAERLGVRVATLDAEVARRRTRRSEGEAPGARVLLADPEPWPEPVDGVALLAAIRATYRRFVVLPDKADVALTLWTMFAWTLDAFSIAPLLAVLSPEKRCGKTTLLHLLHALTPRALFAANITAAALFRAVERYHPTLIVDEADTFLRDSDELRGIMNAGHTRASALVIRTVGDEHEVRTFSVWGAKTIALIGRLPDTLEDRAIVLPMKRRAPGERMERLRLDRLGELEELRRQAARWAADHAKALGTGEPAIPDELHDRAADNWRPLLAIAERVGGAWPEAAQNAAKALSGAGDPSVSGGAAIVLLHDLREIFGAREHLTTEQLLGALLERDEAPWPTWNKGKPITPRQVASLLRPFGIRSTQVHPENVKGYRREDFGDAFTRYLPAHPNVTHNSSYAGHLPAIGHPNGPGARSDGESGATPRNGGGRSARSDRDPLNPAGELEL